MVIIKVAVKNESVSYMGCFSITNSRLHRMLRSLIYYICDRFYKFAITRSIETVILEGRVYISQPKATTTVSNVSNAVLSPIHPENCVYKYFPIQWSDMVNDLQFMLIELRICGYAIIDEFLHTTGNIYNFSVGT